MEKQLSNIRRLGEKLDKKESAIVCERERPVILYHYANNPKAFSILDSKTIRLSDIRKSNDYEELILFLPDLFEEVYNAYLETPFEIEYDNEKGEQAFAKLLELTSKIFSNTIENGDFSNLVLCFSEEADMLSQWRGYANDGKGISIGFSMDWLQKKCDEEKSVLRLEKVIYLTEDQLKKVVKEKARALVDELKAHRGIRLDDATHEEDLAESENLSFFFFNLVRKTLIDSLRYKKSAFKEEKEWRLFLKDQVYKNPDWVIGEKPVFAGPEIFTDTNSFLRNRISFNVSDNNITAYIPLIFAEDAVREIWLGPKSIIAEKDINLYMAKLGYQGIRFFRSKASYR